MINKFALEILYHDTGATLSIVLKKWCDLHRLMVRPKSRIIIICALRKAWDIVEIATMMVILVLMLEVDQGDIVVSLGDFHQFLMGMDVMSGL